MTTTTIRGLVMLAGCAAAAVLAAGTAPVAPASTGVAVLEPSGPRQAAARGGRPIHLRTETAARATREAMEPVLTARGTRMRPVIDTPLMVAAATIEIESLTRRGTRVRTVPAEEMAEASLR